MRGNDAMTSCTADDIATRCSRALPFLPFIRAAGMMMVSTWTSFHDNFAHSFSRRPVSSNIR